MKQNVRQFLESLENLNTVRAIKSILKNIKDDEDIEQYDLNELEQFILRLKPNSPKSVITACYALGAYAKWLEDEKLIEDDKFYQTIQSIDRNELWKVAKQNVPSKFISYEEYKETLHEIGMYEELNALYYQTLLKCIYEGIYCDDMSVVKNLRLSDIKDDTTILLRNDNGESYEIEVTSSLIKDLKELAVTDTWERKNRYGLFKIDVEGESPDTCFKIERRNADKEGSYKFAYYARIRKIAKEYFERSILPQSIFVSGIMHRIKCELEQNDITLEKAFVDNGRDRLVASIISNELKRCNYNIDVRNFREIVKGHIDVFDEILYDTPEYEPVYSQYRELKRQEREKKKKELERTSKILKLKKDIERELKKSVCDIKRNQLLVSNLKAIYDCKCQLCTDEMFFPIIKANGIYYSEVHHIIPLSEGDNEEDTLDSLDNMIVVCPNHHRILHYHKGGYRNIKYENGKYYFYNSTGEIIPIITNYHLTEK